MKLVLPLLLGLLFSNLMAAMDIVEYTSAGCSGSPIAKSTDVPPDTCQTIASGAVMFTGSACKTLTYQDPACSLPVGVGVGPGCLDRDTPDPSRTLIFGAKWFDVC